MYCILDIKSGKSEPWARIQTAAYTLMEKSPELEFDQDSHTYRFRDQVLPSVTGILKEEGFINTDWFTDYGRIRGTFVHKARHLDDLDELDESTVDDTLMPYLSAWRKFRTESGFVPDVSEIPMVCPSLMYCGTPDVFGSFPDKSTALWRGVVELRNDATYRLIPHTDHRDVDVWRSVMAVHNWKKDNLKGRK